LSDVDVDSPKRSYEDYKALYERLALRFPELRSYPIAETVGDQRGPGDPIDDLSDIIGDLSDVIWRYENAGLQEAEWYFHLHFQVHWGMHLRSVSFCLHALMSGDGYWDGAE
jgi:hypothetical protein